MTTIHVIDPKAVRGFNQGYEALVDSLGLALETHQSVALDCEGVNLCRDGTVEILSLCFGQDPSVVFLIDLGPGSLRGADRKAQDIMVEKLRTVLESESVRKIIHDCRMDCDALYHLHGIRLINVHDTSCFHTVLFPYEEDSNLNDTLRRNGFTINESRNKDVYKNNPRFWATRPLTDTMKEWAASDVDKLFKLAEKQEEEAKAQGKLERAISKSSEFANYVVDMKLDKTTTCRIPIGRFIGKGGSNIRSVSKRTGTCIYSDRSTNAPNRWLIFYHTEEALQKVRRAMGVGNDHVW